MHLTDPRSALPFQRLMRLLNRNDRRKFWIVSSIGIIAAIFEMTGVASVLPFLTLVTVPEAISNYGIAERIFQIAGVQNYREKMLFMGVASLVIIAAGNLIGLGSQWLQMRYSATVRTNLSCELFNGYMKQPYPFHQERDVLSLFNVIFTDLEMVVGGYITPLMLSVSKFTVSLLLLGLILWQDATVGVISAIILGGVYWSIYRVLRRRQDRYGKQNSLSAAERQRCVTNALGGIKELLVLGRTTEPIEKFAAANRMFSDAQINYGVAATAPRYILEITAFGGIIVATLCLVWNGQGQEVVPTIALYAFAGYRLLPALQQLYSAALSVRHNSLAISTLERDINLMRSKSSEETTLGDRSELITEVAFESQIALQDVSFRYSKGQRNALKHVTLQVIRNSSVGIVGRSGSGKSTLVDLILGLFDPVEGEICVDGCRLSALTYGAWRKKVGYVPQHPFLANISIRENIAYGLNQNCIDDEKMLKAARLAQVHEFAEHLPGGYNTQVGERGVRLSGGQRQRIGIARALYAEPDVLILDEATSALDGLTETALMKAIQILSRERTVIIIAHRLRTVETCDKILLIENGQLVDEGTYDALMSRSALFKCLANETEKAVAD